VRAVDTRQGARVDGVRYNEQETGLPSKWGSLFTFNTRGDAQIIDNALCKYKDGIFVCKIKMNHVWST
jgi:hypothetical protein